MSEAQRVHKKVISIRKGSLVVTKCGLRVAPERARTRGKAIDCQRCLR